MAIPFHLSASRNARVVSVAIVLFAAAAAITSVHRKPRPWQVREVPIAFWAWRNQSPSEADVREVIEKSQARTIFLRAGQIDYQDGKLRRIRSITGLLPRGIDLHFVYNGTHSLLSQLESIDEKKLAGAIGTVFQEDSNRAERERARIVGLQVDIDVPTRLLARYEKTLKALRALLKPGLTLSITGLPTWMQSAELQSTLSQVDFWVPQFYGAEIPEHADQLIPIASPKDIESFVNSARALNKPFYAGLAAYSCALLYNASGSLINLRGDMDPGTIAADPNLELIDQRPFEGSVTTGSEWRYRYRARWDGVTDKMAMQAGDVLVVDMPSSESLRESSRIVRELAGDKLLGICVFRLPARDDPSTLNAEQVATALSDNDSTTNLKIRFKHDKRQANAWLLEVENTGTASAVGGLKIDVSVTAGAIESVSPQGGVSFETLCHVLDSSNSPVNQPCGQHRANLIRINAAGLRAGQILKTMLVFKTTLPYIAPVSVDTQTDAGERYVDRIEVAVEAGVNG